MSRFALLLTIAGLAAACDSGSSAVAPEYDATITAPVAVDLSVTTPTPALWPGDSVRLEARLLDASGGIVASSDVRWSSSDPGVVRVAADGTVVAGFYGSATITATAQGLAGSARLDVVPGDRYGDLDLEYFREITLGSEFGQAAPVVRKWHDEVRVAVHGSPGDADLAALDAVIRDLSAVAPGLRIRRVESDGNMDVHFAPESRFPEIDPNYQDTNYGFFWVWWDAAQRIDRARVLISTTDITQASRNHLIREEITQSLGMMNDSWRYDDSIYFQGWTETDDFAAIDRMVIEMLYRSEVRAGMAGDAALEVLRGLPRTTSLASN